MVKLTSSGLRGALLFDMLQPICCWDQNLLRLKISSYQLSTCQVTAEQDFTTGTLVLYFSDKKYCLRVKLGKLKVVGQTVFSPFSISWVRNLRAMVARRADAFLSTSPYRRTADFLELAQTSGNLGIFSGNFHLKFLAPETILTFHWLYWLIIRHVLQTCFVFFVFYAFLTQQSRGT